MSGPLFLGIDGGGSTLRVAVVDDQLEPLCSLRESSANPNLIGQDAAQALIGRSIGQALSKANLRAGETSARRR